MASGLSAHAISIRLDPFLQTHIKSLLSVSRSSNSPIIIISPKLSDFRDLPGPDALRAKYSLSQQLTTSILPRVESTAIHAPSEGYFGHAKRRSPGNKRSARPVKRRSQLTPPRLEIRIAPMGCQNAFRTCLRGDLSMCLFHQRIS